MLPEDADRPAETVAGFLDVNWPAPPGVRAVMSTRRGGLSRGPFAGFNLGDHVGDDPGAVHGNRARFAQVLGARPRWLRQVHGCGVVDAGEAGDAEQAADAAFSTRPGIGCAVLVADCLPVLFALRHGGGVAAAHAGWRGLAGGVLEAAIASLCAASGSHPHDLQAWLGPCIGPRQFEVGDDVREAFGPVFAACFKAHCRRDGTPAWLADLPALARARLSRAGLDHVYGGQWCTVERPLDFFSYRRDGQTGRLAAAIAWVD